MTARLGLNTQTTTYGVLVGIANYFKDNFDKIMVRDTCANPSGALVADTIQLGTFKSTALIGPRSRVWWDAFGASVTMTIGDATYPAGLASAFSVAAAGQGDFWALFTGAKLGQPLWQILGYAADPKRPIVLFATIGGATTSNAANFTWEILGHNV